MDSQGEFGSATVLLVGLLEEEIKNWNEAAQHCESLLACFSGRVEEMDWLITSVAYRERAESLKLILEQLSGAGAGLPVGPPC
jgi:hypothetical protein